MEDVAGLCNTNHGWWISIFKWKTDSCRLYFSLKTQQDDSSSSNMPYNKSDLKIASVNTLKPKSKFYEFYQRGGFSHSGGKRN